MVYGSNNNWELRCLVPVKPRALSSLQAKTAVARAIDEFRQSYQPPKQYTPPGYQDEWLDVNRIEGNADHSASWEAGRRYMTRAGFRVRSKAEKIIADFLHIEGFNFVYEPLLQVGSHWMRPDFYLTELELPYEHFGMNTPDYRHRAEEKIVRYVSAGIPFVYTTFKDEPDLEDILTDKLVDYY